MRKDKKVILIVEKACKKGNRKDNLTVKERKGIRKTKERKDIVIQAADKGGVITVMKEWINEGTVFEVNKVVGNNDKRPKEDLIKLVVRTSE
jgi:hypothetical protein